MSPTNRYVFLAEYKVKQPYILYAVAPRTATTDSNEAKQFPTREACQSWIDLHMLGPGYEPVEHGFMVAK